MSLPSLYVQSPKCIKDLFSKISEGQAPTQFTQQVLKDLGLTSSNHRAFIPLLKTLGFLSEDGKPTQKYHDYRDRSKSKAVITQALRDVYADLFVIKEKPTRSDQKAIQGKFKSALNTTDRMASMMAYTFFALLELADLDVKAEQGKPHVKATPKKEEDSDRKPLRIDEDAPPVTPSLHYNIQIHLPATKDTEVYNAIFRSLKEYLF